MTRGYLGGWPCEEWTPSCRAFTTNANVKEAKSTWTHNRPTTSIRAQPNVFRSLPSRPVFSSARSYCYRVRESEYAILLVFSYKNNSFVLFISCGKVMKWRSSTFLLLERLLKFYTNVLLNYFIVEMVGKSISHVIVWFEHLMLTSKRFSIQGSYYVYGWIKNRVSIANNRRIFLTIKQFSILNIDFFPRGVSSLEILFKIIGEILMIFFTNGFY